MTTVATFPRIPISPELQTRFREQILAAQPKNATAIASQPAQLEKNFKEFLQTTEKTDGEFYRAADLYIKKFKQNGTNFDYDLPQRLLNEKNIVDFNDTGKANLIQLLVKHRLLFAPKQITLLSDEHKTLMAKALDMISENELVANLKNLKWTEKLDKLAKLLMEHYQNDAREVQNLLEKAYGPKTSFAEIAEKLLAGEIEPIGKSPSRDVRTNLQNLLLEVIKLEPNSDVEGSIDLYKAAEDDYERNKVAELIKAKFPKQAVEIFQTIAMDNSEEHSSSQELNLRKNAISQYAAMNAKNCTETLVEIMLASKQPSVIYHVLLELFQRKDFKLDNLFAVIKNEIAEHKASAVLFTLLNKDANSISQLMHKIGKETNDLFKLLLAKIPKLDDALDAVEASFDLKEYVKEDSKKQVIDWVLDKFPILNVIKEFLSPESDATTQANAIALLGRIEDKKMIDFHRPNYGSQAQTVASRELAQALGLNKVAHSSTQAIDQSAEKPVLRNRFAEL